jgi:hypothetical protein
MPNFISEDDIEQAILQKLQEQHGFQLLNCYTVDADNLNDRSHRTNRSLAKTPSLNLSTRIIPHRCHMAPDAHGHHPGIVL